MLTGISCYLTDELRDEEEDDIRYALIVEFGTIQFEMLVGEHLTQEEVAHALRSFADRVEYDNGGLLH